MKAGFAVATPLSRWQQEWEARRESAAGDFPAEPAMPETGKKSAVFAGEKRYRRALAPFPARQGGPAARREIVALARDGAPTREGPCTR